LFYSLNYVSDDKPCLCIVLFVSGGVIVCIKYRKQGRKVKEREKRLEDLEMEIKQIAREGN